jgi:hypothetical protein
MTHCRCSTSVRRAWSGRIHGGTRGGASRAAAVCVCAALELAASPANAENWYWQFAAGPSGRWLPSSPRYAMDRKDTPLRSVPGGNVAEAGTTGWLGGYAEIGCAFADRWQIPLIGLAVYGPIGSYARVLAARDGSFVELRPWTGLAIDVPLPGFGVRLKQRRWMFTAAVRTAIVLTSMDARVANGAEWIDTGRVNATSFAVRAEVTACRRIDPEARACLWIAPNVYQVAFANGGSFGLRWEWGP